MRRIKLITLIACAALALTTVRHVTNKQHAVTLTWQRVSSNSEYVVTGYNIYRSSVSGRDYSRLASGVSESQYQDGRVTAGKTYFYVVSAMDDKGRESPYSAEIRVKVPWW